MIVKKLAINPINTISESSDAAVPSPKIALKPSASGVADVPIVAAPPPTPVFRNRVRTANRTSVLSPQIVARGMSRFGSCDSSAASGSSSIAR